MAENEVVKLPQPSRKGGVSLEESIEQRRSVRAFSQKDLTLQQISQLLWSAQGLTGNGSFRSAPSASALYPLEIYLATKDGLFHYETSNHTIEVVTHDDIRKQLAVASFGQGFVEEAPADIIICAEYARVGNKYGTRAERYVHMEAGHAAENLHLQAVALGLGSVPVGAFDDKAVKKACMLPKEYEPLYIIPVGYIKN
ncbi:MAG: SagB/ThcOx family dehydrogenase [Candidatus Omnitrophota bacterium]